MTIETSHVIEETVLEDTELEQDQEIEAATTEEIVADTDLRIEATGIGIDHLARVEMIDTAIDLIADRQDTMTGEAAQDQAQATDSTAGIETEATVEIRNHIRAETISQGRQHPTTFQASCQETMLARTISLGQTSTVQNARQKANIMNICARSTTHTVRQNAQSATKAIT